MFMNKSLMLTLALAGVVGLLDAQNLNSSDKGFIESAAGKKA